MNREECIERCNELLRGEMAAVETDEKVLEKFEDGDSSESLQRIHSEHLAHTKGLIDQIVRLGGEPAQDSGTWGTFAGTVTECGSFMGENSALAVLKQGEEHGKRNYENVLANQEMLPECKDYILTTLLPRTHQHISTLNNM